jgi:hypothetical protein
VETLQRTVHSFRSGAEELDKNGLPRVKKVKWRRHSDVVRSHRDTIRQRRLELAGAVGLLQPAQRLVPRISSVVDKKDSQLMIRSQKHASLILDVHQVTTLGMESLASLIRESTDQLQESINAMSLSPISSPISSPVSSPISSPLPPPYSPSSPMMKDEKQVIRIQTSILHQCSMTCLCQCHRRRQIRSSDNSLIQQCLGQFFLSYSSIPVWDTRPCNDPRCVNRDPVAVDLIYMLPEWLLNKALGIYVSWKSMSGQGASLHIRVPRIISEDSDVFNAITADDVPGLQVLLGSGKFLPTDVTPLGTTMLLVSLLLPHLLARKGLLLMIMPVSMQCAPTWLITKQPSSSSH